MWGGGAGVGLREGPILEYFVQCIIPKGWPAVSTVHLSKLLFQ